MTPIARRLLALFACLGLGASAASTYIHVRLIQQPGYLSFCDVSATVSCTQVYLSRFGSIAGVPVSLGGTLWFTLVLVLIVASARSSKTFAENVPAYVFALSTAALAAVLYLAYASFFVLKTVCILCVLTYVAVLAMFVLAGAATSFPMTTLPRRAWRDIRAVAASPGALAVSVLLLAGAASAVAFFPREGATSPQAGAQTPPLLEDTRSEFERWYTAQPRVPILVPTDGATVVIVKFNDYQCPPCRQTFENYRSILAKYRAERPGLVKFMTKDYPLEPECNGNAPAGTHLAACEAAVAVRLARLHRRDDALEDWLFANQPTLSPPVVREAARTVGHVDDFDREYPRVLEQVKADVALGRQLGVRVTPTFFINGVKVEGGLQPRYFEAAIAHELKAAERPKK